MNNSFDTRACTYNVEIDLFNLAQALCLLYMWLFVGLPVWTWVQEKRLACARKHEAREILDTIYLQCGSASAAEARASAMYLQLLCGSASAVEARAEAGLRIVQSKRLNDEAETLLTCANCFDLLDQQNQAAFNP